MSVTITQLTTFLAVARLGSVTLAAVDLDVSQPSVSAAMTALEKELAVDLTQQIGRGIDLTPAGQTYARYAATILRLYEDGKRAAQMAEPQFTASLVKVGEGPS